MSSIRGLYSLASMACLAIALAAGNVVAQEESDQPQSDQPQSSQDEQSQADPSQPQPSAEQAQQDQQQQQQEQKQQEQKQQEQQQAQDQQRQQQAQRDQQSRNRDQSSQRRFDSSRERGWPQPNGQEYGSDSLQSGGQRGERGRQGGLGVGLRADGGDGVLVAHVHSGSPAEEMGIREGDRITAVNGQQVASVQQFIARIRNMDPGQQIELDIRRARGGNERTVRGELETRQEALAGHADEGRMNDERSGRQWGQFGPQDRGEWQTSYDERRSSTADRPGQINGRRLDQIARQVDRLSQELDDLRVALQSIRRQSSGSGERTARYDEYENTTGQRDADARLDGRGTYRQAERDRGFELRRDRRESDDRFDNSPGGETGEGRLQFGSEDMQEQN